MVEVTDAGEEPHVTGMPVGESPRHEYVGYGGGADVDSGQLKGEDHSPAGAHPQEVAADQQRGDSEAGGLVLPDYRVRTWIANVKYLN